MLVAGFDLETTGLDVDTCDIIEVGAVLWDTERQAPLSILSELVYGPHLAKLDPRITELTGICDEDLRAFGIGPEMALTLVAQIFARADVVVAHNGNLFDRPVYENNCHRFHIEPAHIGWVDTTCDIEFPGDITTRKLKHLAAEHGFLNPFAHRAVFDVLTMLKVTARYDWDQILRYSRAPNLVIRAETNYSQKELAKKQAFRWDVQNKMWVKSIKDFQLDEARKVAREAGFCITVLGE